MPIYEFYCSDCNTLFNFFSRTVNTRKVPACPKCGKAELSRQVSVFAVTGRATEDGDAADPPLDEARIEKAMQVLSAQAERIDENDPRQAAGLMRKLTDMTGLELGEGMAEAMRRMEKGEDPDRIEAEMGDLLEAEDPFVAAGKKHTAGRSGRRQPVRDETLYDL